MKRSELLFGVLKVPADFFMTVLAFQAAYKLRLLAEDWGGLKPIDYSVLPTETEYFQFSLLAALALIIVFGLGKTYSMHSTFKFRRELWKVITLGLIWSMTMITYFFIARTFPFSRGAILISWLLAIIFVTFGRGFLRIIQSQFLQYGFGRRNLVFIGANNVSEEVRKKLSKDPSYKILGFIGQSKNQTQLKHLGEHKELIQLIQKHDIDEIIQTKTDISHEDNEAIIEICELNNVNYRFIPDLLEVRRTNVTIETIGEIPIISLKPTPLDGWGKVTKRILDIIGATIGLILLLPLFIAVSIAIKRDSKGPILFTKLEDGSDVKRVGQYGKPFKFYKFRSMQHNTHSKRYTELADKDTRKGQPLVKIKNDPRVTKVGKFIRKYSIDELPQLWSVLKGDMSLVGPRPHLPEEVAKYQKHHYFVLTIKPGLSGLAQISGRSDLSFEDEVRLDRYYIENWSIWLDLKIIFRTIFTVVKGHQE